MRHGRTPVKGAAVSASRETGQDARRRLRRTYCMIPPLR